MTAERKIVITAIAEHPFILWKGLKEPDDIKKAMLDRRLDNETFITDEEIDMTILPGAYEKVVEMLKDGWKLDPFFHTSGRPWTVNNGHVWVLVKGTPEEITELNPFVELPKPEVTEADQRTTDKFYGIVDVVDVTPEALEDGRVKDLTEKGYTVFNILKGSIILVKRQNTDATASEAEETPGEVKAE